VLPDPDAFSLAPCSLFQGRCTPALPVPAASLTAAAPRPQLFPATLPVSSAWQGRGRQHETTKDASRIAVVATALGLSSVFVSHQPEFISAAQAAQKVTHFVNGNTETWSITEPDVTQPIIEFQQIRFQPGDKVSVTGGGCVHTGGSGKTWKRYVDPLGPNSDRLYHGMVVVPGAMGSYRPMISLDSSVSCS
jgi:hypothetical protein